MERIYLPTRFLNPNRIFLLSKICRLVDPYIRKHHNFVDSQGRVRIFQVECAITHGCNLKCEQCSFMCGYRRGIVPAKDVILWFDTWSKKINPRTFLILGGEPLLHPDLAEIILAAGRCWPQARIKVVSNGLLIPKVADKVFDALFKVGGSIEVSLHFNTSGYRQKFQDGLARLRNLGIPFNVRPSNTHWLKLYQVDDRGRILPNQSIPERAWNNCCCRTCQAIDDNKLFKCSHLANWRQAFREKVLGDEWSAVWNYIPLTSDATEEEIIAHLLPKPIQECRLCTEKKEYITARELP
jgi:hypothetical protein